MNLESELAVRSGLLLTLEGGEGAGKSTALAAIEAKLRREGIDVTTTREPGGTPMGEAVRRIVLDPDFTPLCAESELLLMFAARAQHVRQTIEPALACGRWVVSDRYTDASYAYQGGGRGLPRSAIAALERLAVRDSRPRRTWLLDLPVEQGLTRAAARSDADRMERESLAFFERVRAAYRAEAVLDPARFVLIDATQPTSAVVAAIERDLEGLIASWRRGRA
jgi:dTMP kinase